MPINNIIFRDHFRLRNRQRADRVAHSALPNPSAHPISFDGPSDIIRPRTRRHHVRRGAISEGTGQPNVPTGNRTQATSQPEIRIRTINTNEIEITFGPSTGRNPHRHNRAYQRQVREWTQLADQIQHGLVDEGSPDFQARLNAGIASLRNLLSSSRRGQAMDDNSRPRHRDTYRYGREGWAIDRGSASSQRPATIPGSDFAVPDSTLNLFQSVDLFAPPPPRPTMRDHAMAVIMHVETYNRRLETVFSETVAARLRGHRVPRGKLFTLSMELSRARQLSTILEGEFIQLDQDEREASRLAASSRNATADSQGREEPPMNEQATYMAADDDDTDSEIGEPEGWSTLDFGFDDEYPEQICFHIGSHELIYPVEEIENWLVDERRRQRRAHTLSRGRRYILQGGLHNSRRILHTLVVPQAVSSRWLNDRYYDSADPDDTDYEDDYELYDSRDYLEEDEEENDEDHMVVDEEEYMDNEGGASSALQVSLAAEQFQASTAGHM